MRAVNRFHFPRQRGPRVLILVALSAGACSEPDAETAQHAVNPAHPVPARDAAHTSEDAGSPVPVNPPPRPLAGDDEADAFVPRDCPALGFDYALGCENCPSSTVTCPCNPFPEANGLEVTSFQLGCYYGTCFLDVSCEVWCDAVTREPARGLSVYSCPSSRSCASQSECGDGYCYGETADQRGECVSGVNGSDCFDASDCRGGFCGPRGCTSGGPDALCTTVADCAAGRCVGDVEAEGFGFCSTGQYHEKCKSDDDCAPELYCHNGTTRCTDGALGAACHNNEQCQSGACSLGGCVSGELGGDCDDDADCQSGHCRRPEGVQPGMVIGGICTDGAEPRD